MSGTNETQLQEIFDHCKDLVNVYPDICKYDDSYYGYRIWIVPNALFLGLFSLSFLGFAGVFVLTRFRNVGFSVAMLLGVLGEILGYLGRVLSWQDQWSQTGFLMQICCLTIAPAFLAAGIYFCLRSIVMAFGAQNSRIKPTWYPRIFIPCDVISILLQAIGGAMASVASQDGSDLTTGNNIMIAGLAFQVITLFVFIVLTSDFAIRTLRHRENLNQDPAVVSLRNSLRFRLFLGSLVLSTICIFWRCCFRVAELSDGWSGPIMKEQNLFVGFEGVMVVIAVLVLNVFHPNNCFRGMENYRPQKKKGAKKEKESRYSSNSPSDEELR
ncbi:putative sphingoid long-chain base transporter RSB1 [Pestalotiopsis sp. NC0098]|nr:putative sphingoid long-chain base transporter RSB1 [Pestalotiopsis sp. NC0098]